MNPKSITQRLTAVMWLLSAISCSIAAGVSTYLILQNSEWFATQNLKAAEANLISLGVLDLISNSSAGELDPLVPKTVDSAQLSEVVRIYDAHGKLIYANINTRDLTTAARLISRHVDRGIFVISGNVREYYSLVRSYKAPGGRVFWLQIATPRPVIRQVLRNNVIPFSIMFFMLLLFSFLVARLVAVQTLSPLSQVMTQIDLLDSDRIKSWHPLSLSGVPSDFRPFIEKINALILRSQRSLLKFHQIGRYIAHEVRTPLTIIQGEIETSLMDGIENPEKTRSLLESALQEVSRIEQIVHTVLRLAAKDRKTDPYQPEIFDLVKFWKDLQAEFERLAGRPVIFDTRGSGSFLVLMDKELLSLLVSNFARNIMRHTADTVRVFVHIESLDYGEVLLEIEDTGIGMPEDLIEELNDPQSVGRRVGLGLSLCKEIVNISKIQMAFTNRDPSGLKISVTFPRAPGDVF